MHCIVVSLCCRVHHFQHLRTIFSLTGRFIPFLYYPLLGSLSNSLSLSFAVAEAHLIITPGVRATLPLCALSFSLPSHFSRQLSNIGQSSKVTCTLGSFFSVLVFAVRALRVWLLICWCFLFFAVASNGGDGGNVQ